MVFGLLERLAQRRAISKFKHSPFGQSLHKHTQEYFFTGKTVLRHLSPEQKQSHINDFATRILQISASSNPFLKLREELAGLVYAYAELQVLCLMPADIPDLYGASPYISGELNHYILKCAEHIKELKEVVWNDPSITREGLTSYCNLQCALFLYFVNGVNLMRVEIGDYNDVPEKDWLHPFITSMLIYCEDTYRQKIGLPSLLPNLPDGLIHSTFMNIVLNGDKNPLFEWETSFRLRHSDAAYGRG
jgi:hypothetical protein